MMLIALLKSRPELNITTSRTCCEPQGLQETKEPGAPLCRWQYEGISIDVMPCDESVLGFSNGWYKPGIANSIRYQLPSGRQILIFSTPYLLASKIEAFIGRGGGNFYFSSDIEDIVALLDGRFSLFEEVQQGDDEVKAFLSGWFRAELKICVPSRLLSSHPLLKIQVALACSCKELKGWRW
jgi:hypothetical protein